jgi:hypothetical protein
VSDSERGSKYNGDIAGFEQQDAHEFFMVLLNAIHVQSGGMYLPPSLSLSLALGSDLAQARTRRTALAWRTGCLAA